MEQLGKIYLYAKITDNIQHFEYVLQSIQVKQRFADVLISTEPRRSYYELDKIKQAMTENDVCMITNLASLGLNEQDIAAGLDWFIKKPRMLVIANFNTSYIWGVSQPMNQAILQTLQQALLGKNDGHTVMIPEHRKSNAGRKRLAFPDKWEVLYDQWERKEIDSKTFLESSGLKKATFYNLLTEYRQILQANEKYFERYKSV